MSARKYILILCIISGYLDAQIVLETKRIVLPDYPHAFNPSIIRWKGKLLLSFRVIPDAQHSFNSWLGLVWLNEEFIPVSKPQLLCLRSDGLDHEPTRAEDGRLIAVGERLYLIYSDNLDATVSAGGFRVYSAEIQCSEETFLVHNRECWSSFEQNNKKRREKNWVPFDYFAELLFAYSLAPHRILQPLPGTGHCDTFSCSQRYPDWGWGELRGGTPALYDGEKYLAFFHSAKLMASDYSKGKEIPHYFMGAYTFSPEPPFEIAHMSEEPIIAQEFYTGADYKPYWKPVQVVFPCGFIADDEFIWITYGRQDHEMWVAKLDKKKLYESLKSVQAG